MERFLPVDATATQISNVAITESGGWFETHNQNTIFVALYVFLTMLE